MNREREAKKRELGNVYIKQEPMEPEVEIHEPVRDIPRSIGNVSITPIPKIRVAPKPMNPDIMKLVQNNPNITIRTMSGKNNGLTNGIHRESPPVESRRTPTNGEDKCYRCSSCSKPFSNKSNLYFHKKTQCGGSKYPCPFCKKRFGTESAYSSHIFYSHPE